MKQNGTLLAHGREWPLYEHRDYVIIGVGGKRQIEVEVLEMRPEDQAEKDALDKSDHVSYGWE